MSRIPAERESLLNIIISYVLLTVGALLGVVQVLIFMEPANIVPGGLTSLSIILNELFNSPIGLVTLLANVPILVLAFRMLDGWRALARTIYVVVVFSIALDLLAPFLPTDGITGDRLLSALFGGALGGIAAGIIYRAGGTFGGTSTLGRIIQDRTGTPMSTTALYTDAALIGAAGVVFGWEAALYAVIALVVGGAAVDYVLEGPSVIRTLVIITEHPDAIADVVINRLRRSVTGWEAQGMYTGRSKTVLYVTVSRSEANRLRQMVQGIDPTAFIVVGQGQAAYGGGFRVPRTNGHHDQPEPTLLQPQLDSEILSGV